MPKLTCLMLCVVVASFGSVHVTKPDASNLRDYLKPALEACMNEQDHKVTSDDINRAAEEGNPTIIHPCFNGCVFKKSGFINDKGQYDLDTGLANLRKVVQDDEQYTKLKEIATECTSGKDEVSDGEAGCERGGKLSACFLENIANVRV